jgi:K+-transporting ATPase KdpF subunit
MAWGRTKAQVGYAGCVDAGVYGSLFLVGFQLRFGLPEVEVGKMGLVTAVALILAVLLMGYLAATLLFPERF